MRVVIGAGLGWIGTMGLFVHLCLSAGAVLNWQTWPVFAVIGLPIALLGSLAVMLIFAMTKFI